MILPSLIRTYFLDLALETFFGKVKKTFHTPEMMRGQKYPVGLTWSFGDDILVIEKFTPESEHYENAPPMYMVSSRAAGILGNLTEDVLTSFLRVCSEQ